MFAFAQLFEFDAIYRIKANTRNEYNYDQLFSQVLHKNTAMCFETTLKIIYRCIIVLAMYGVIDLCDIDP